MKILSFLGFILLGILSTNWVEKHNLYFNNLNPKTFKIKRIHPHHSIYGLLFISLGLFVFKGASAAFLVAFGVGVIIQHTISEKRFVFLEIE